MNEQGAHLVPEVATEHVQTHNNHGIAANSIINPVVAKNVRKREVKNLRRPMDYGFVKIIAK
jgi:hypothetical protein